MKKLFVLTGILTVTFFGGAGFFDRLPPAQGFFSNAFEKFAFFAGKSERLVKTFFGLEKIKALEAKYSPQDVIPGIELIDDFGVRTELNFFPHLLMHVKYAREGLRSGTQEGVILWSLVNGEMVLDTDTWDCSQGFEDCLLFRADQKDFKILQALALLGGISSKESLRMLLELECKDVEADIKQCCKKKLVFVSGNKIGLLFRSLNALQGNTTKLKSSLVAYSTPRKSKFYPREYSSDQVRNLAKMAFGSNFVIVKHETVFVPVYKVSLKSETGALRSEFINAVNGKKLSL
ncbi:MAG: hypothetical protein RSB82_01035 [Victivallaceae bacterium]